MKHLKLILGLVISFGFVFISCNKDDDPEPEKTYLVKDIVFDGKTGVSYTYNQKGHLETAIIDPVAVNKFFKRFHSDKPIKFVMYYHENENLKLLKTYVNDVLQDSLPVSYPENNVLIDKYMLKDKKWEKDKRMLLLKDNSGEFTGAIISQFKDDGELIPIELDTYTFENGNLKTWTVITKEMERKDVEYKRTFTYTDYKNTLKTKEFLPFIIRMPVFRSNHFAKEETIVDDGMTMEVKHTYTVNNDRIVISGESIFGTEKYPFIFNYY